MQEGAFSSRFFKPDTDFDNFIHKSLEMDIELTVAEFPKEYKHCFTEKKGKPGFLQAKVLGAKCMCTSCITKDQSSPKEKEKNIERIYFH